jgi:hypothetical protein
VPEVKILPGYRFGKWAGGRANPRAAALALKRLLSRNVSCSGEPRTA